MKGSDGDKKSGKDACAMPPRRTNTSGSSLPHLFLFGRCNCMKTSNVCYKPNLNILKGQVKFIPSSSESGSGVLLLLLPFLDFFPGAVAGAFWLPRGILYVYCATKAYPKKFLLRVMREHAGRLMRCCGCLHVTPPQAEAR